MTGKKIKVALCLSGEPRSSMASFPYMHETFLLKNPLFQTDVYIHSLKGFRALESYQPKEYFIENINIVHHQSVIKSYLDSHIPQSLTPLNDSFSTFSNTLINQFLMFEGIKKCFDLIKEPYDIYIRARYDIHFSSQFFLEPILLDILNNKYDMFIPLPNPTKILLNEYNDQISIGNYKSMKLYSDIINQIPNLVKETQTANSQCWLKKWLDINNIKVNEFYVNYGLIRQSNITVNNKKFDNFLDQ